MLKKVLKEERISIGEINSAVRKEGNANYESIEAIVLEATGDITIIKNYGNNINYEVMMEVNNIP